MRERGDAALLEAIVHTTGSIVIATHEGFDPPPRREPQSVSRKWEPVADPDVSGRSTRFRELSMEYARLTISSRFGVSPS